jgi:TolB protein
MIRIKRVAAIAVTTATAATTAWLAGALLPGAAQAAGAATPTVAYLRTGDIYVATGTIVHRLTTTGGNTRPHWSPDGGRIAYLHAGAVWVMNADGAAKQRVATASGAPSWSPDGRWLAFVAPGCAGPTIYKIASTAPFGTPVALVPSGGCTGQAADAEPPAAGPGLVGALRHDDAVAWSPDGTRIAFRGGDCESMVDDCLSVANLATGGQATVDAYGGGGQVVSGFAVVPAWRPDGARLAWTAYAEGESTDTSAPVHVTEAGTTGADRRTVGEALDRELAYVDTGRAVLTSTHNGASWITLVDLATGQRTYLRPGSQPSPRPGAGATRAS